MGSELGPFAAACGSDASRALTSTGSPLNGSALSAAAVARKTSDAPLVSPATRSVAVEVNATRCPSGVIVASDDAPWSVGETRYVSMAGYAATAGATIGGSTARPAAMKAVIDAIATRRRGRVVATEGAGA